MAEEIKEQKLQTAALEHITGLLETANTATGGSNKEVMVASVDTTEISQTQISSITKSSESIGDKFYKASRR